MSVSDADAPQADTVWYDLYNPTREEEKQVEAALGIDVPTRDEIQELELSSRLYHENGAVFCTATAVTKADSPEPETHAISFILKGNVLVTLRYSDPYAFRNYPLRIEKRAVGAQEGVTVLVDLVEASINRMADILEIIAHTLDYTNRALFRPAITEQKQRQSTAPNFEEMLRIIGVQADLLSKISESLHSFARMLHFTGNTEYFPEGEPAHTRSQILLKDIDGLHEQARFLSSKTGFLLDATLGLVGLQQTAIIKIFSVASVVFLPPTLVASMYGMNFQLMPELAWKAGYPLAIGLMILSAWLPYRYFKRKKWL